MSELMEVDVNSPQFKELLIRLYQNINNMALVLNVKDTGIYNNSQFINGQTFFPNPTLTSASTTFPAMRQAYRLAVIFGALPNTGAKSVAHGITITSSTTFTRIYGEASDTTGNNYIPLPYASPTLVNNIQLDVSATNVTVTTGSNRTNFNECKIILEWLSS
ncbi:MAG: hypothetical protein ACHQVS_00555 [Candidatus Babeliales bacterium]